MIGTPWVMHKRGSLSLSTSKLLCLTGSVTLTAWGLVGGARIAFSFDSCSLWSFSVPQICLKEIKLPNSIENYEDQTGTEALSVSGTNCHGEDHWGGVNANLWAGDWDIVFLLCSSLTHWGALTHFSGFKDFLPVPCR